MRSRSASGEVLCDVPRAISSDMLDLALLDDVRQLLHLTRDTGQLRRHDRHVDQHEREEDQVGGGDVLAGLVERQGGHQTSCGAAERPVVKDGSPDRRRFNRLSCIDACLEASSYLHRVTNSSAMPASDTAKVKAICPGRLLVESNVRGWVSAWAIRTAMKFSGTNAPPTMLN